MPNEAHVGEAYLLLHEPNESLPWTIQPCTVVVNAPTGRLDNMTYTGPRRAENIVEVGGRYFHIPLEPSGRVYLYDPHSPQSNVWVPRDDVQVYMVK